MVVIPPDMIRLVIDEFCLGSLVTSLPPSLIEHRYIIAQLNRSYRHTVQMHWTAARLARYSDMHPMRLHWRDGILYSRNQLSTFELLLHLRRLYSRHHTRWRTSLLLCNRACSQDRSVAAAALSDATMLALYRIVRSQPSKYGTYASSNNWSPTFSPSQLEQFVRLVHDTFLPVS